MKNYIIWLDAADDESFVRIGSKATNLARLCRRGFTVPAAFCITTDAFRDSLSSLTSLNRGNDFETSSETDSEALLSMSMLPDLMIQISDAYRSLIYGRGPEVKVAARSSASSEDLPEASYAGQYLSILNIANEEALLLAVRQCWSSCYSLRSQAYQSRLKQNGDRMDMAIIVQLMVHAEIAGVLFTVDPSGKDNRHIALEATTGLGDGIAAGTETGVHLTAHRETLEITKAFSSTQVIDAELIKQVDWIPLLKLSLLIEDLMNAPQDIEWAFANQQFWILQSRPITVMPSPACRQIWSRANIGEILPGVVTPLTWSIFRPTLMSAGLHRSKSLLTLHWKWRHPSGSWPDSPRLFSGRAYLELASVYCSFCSLPGIDKNILQRLLGFEFNLCKEEEFPAKHSRRHIMDPVRASFYWLEMLGITGTLSAKAKRLMNNKADTLTDLTGVLPDHPEAVLQHIDRLLGEAAKTLALHLQCTSMAFSAFGLIHTVIKESLGAEEALKFDIRMTGDFHDITTAEQGIAIWDLAQAAMKESLIKEPLFALKSVDEMVKTWKSYPNASSFCGLWDAFLDRFGHRGTEELELSVAHWDEDPSIVLQTMREIIIHRLPDPRERLHRQQEASLQITEAMINELSSKGFLWRAVLVKRLISVYYAMVQLRENMKYCVVSKFSTLRKTFLTLSTILNRPGLLSANDDIFFLQYAEIIDLITNQSQQALDLMTLVKERRAMYEEYSQTSPPDIWVSSEGLDNPLNLFPGQDVAVLQGIGCSPGLITGLASVLTSVNENSVVEQGRILVAPSIDPGLTPLFLSAIGVVTEIGGILSHGATLAREYGLPAVVGLPHATRIIQDGQQITIDGSTGRVYLGLVA